MCFGIRLIWISDAGAFIKKKRTHYINNHAEKHHSILFYLFLSNENRPENNGIRLRRGSISPLVAAIIIIIISHHRHYRQQRNFPNKVARFSYNSLSLVLVLVWARHLLLLLRLNRAQLAYENVFAVGLQRIINNNHLLYRHTCTSYTFIQWWWEMNA